MMDQQTVLTLWLVPVQSSRDVFLSGPPGTWARKTFSLGLILDPKYVRNSPYLLQSSDLYTYQDQVAG